MIKKVLLCLFLFLTVLYYFLRFQWGWDNIVNICHLTLLILFSFFGIFFSVKNKNKYTGNDAAYLLIFLYSLFLLLYTYLSGSGVNGLLYSLKDYVMPISLFLFYSLYIYVVVIYKLRVCIHILQVLLA